MDRVNKPNGCTMTSCNSNDRSKNIKTHLNKTKNLHGNTNNSSNHNNNDQSNNLDENSYKTVIRII